MNPLYQFKTTITKFCTTFVILLMMLNFNTSKAACNQGLIYISSHHDTAGNFYFSAYLTTGISKKRFTWNFGDSTTGSGYRPTHKYSRLGTYNVCVYVWDSTKNCGDTVCMKACFFKYPKISFTKSGQSITTTIPCNSALKYSWDFGDGTTKTGCNFTHTYANKDIYRLSIFQIKDTITGCKDSLYQYEIDTVADFTRCGFRTTFDFYGTGAIDSRYVYSTNHYNDNPKKGKEYWYWGDGSTTVTSPIYSTSYFTHKYTRSGTFTTCHILEDSTSGCRDTTCKQVKIDSCNVTANFTYTVVGRKVTFTNTSSSNATSYYWTFGSSGSSSTKNPTYTFNADGTFNVCLTSSNSSCSKTICKSIKIETCNLAGDFMYVIDTATGKVLFYNMSAKGIVSSWVFGDGQYDNTGLHKSEHTYNKNNDYQACLNITSCDLTCTQTICKPIKFKVVKPDTTCKGKQAYFTASYSRTNARLSLYNQSNFGNYFKWNIIKKSGNVTHLKSTKDSVSIYSSDSVYNVCLIVFDTNTLCTDTFCATLLRDSVKQLSVRYLNNDGQFNVYPNPASNKITIAYKGNDEEIIVKITDMNGKLIRTVNVSNGTPLELSTAGLASGVYMVQPQNQSPPFKLILQ